MHLLYNFVFFIFTIYFIVQFYLFIYFFTYNNTRVILWVNWSFASNSSDGGKNSFFSFSFKGSHLKTLYCLNFNEINFPEEEEYLSGPKKRKNKKKERRRRSTTI